MSNDLIRSIQGQLVNIEGGVDDDTRAVAGSGDFNKRISIKGACFRKMVGGKEAGIVEERHMNVVFVKMSHTPSRTFYASGYQEGAKVAPVCWSSDTKHPDTECRTPQNTTCEGCQFSVKGSGQNGKGTACRLSWRTAVVLPGDPAGDVMQLVLPATSVFGKEERGAWPFRAYIQMLANNNISAGRVVTKMFFDTSAAVPTLRFQPVAAVGANDVQTIIEQGKSPAAENAVKLTVFQQDEGTEAPAQPVAAQAAVATVAPVTAAVPTQQDLPLAEPTLRGGEAVPQTTEKNLGEVMKKWGKKK